MLYSVVCLIAVITCTMPKVATVDATRGIDLPFQCDAESWSEKVPKKTVTSTTASIQARQYVLTRALHPEKVSQNHIHVPPWEPGPNCSGITFGKTNFKTGRHGSRIMLVMVGLQYAKKYGMCMMTLTGQQRHELHPMLDLTSKQEVIELIDFVGEDHCVGDLAQERALPRTQKPQFYHDNCDGVKTLKHMHLFDANGSSLPSLHHAMVRTFDHRMLPYEFPEILPAFFGREDMLLIHLRGGDVWKRRSFWLDHIQPPCSYYLAAFRNGPNNQPYKSALVVSEDTLNPCHDYLLRALPNNSVTFLFDLLKNETRLAHDAALLMRARHIALSSSALPLATIFFNRNLTSLHIPYGSAENLWDYWAAFAWSEKPMSYTQHLYSFPDFNDEHRLPPSQRFCTYSEDNITVRTIESL